MGLMPHQNGFVWRQCDCERGLGDIPSSQLKNLTALSGVLRVLVRGSQKADCAFEQLACSTFG